MPRMKNRAKMQEEMKPAAHRQEVPSVCHWHELDDMWSGRVKVERRVVEDSKKAPQTSVSVLE